MILVVADTGPINYLVLIGEIGVLAHLYDRVIVPQSVLAELTHRDAPGIVAGWARNLPPWAEVRSAARIDPMGALGPGATEAIALARELSAAAVLLDEAEARRRAIALGISVAGTIRVLEGAAERGLIDLQDAFERLLRTNFRVAPSCCGMP